MKWIARWVACVAVTCVSDKRVQQVTGCEWSTNERWGSGDGIRTSSQWGDVSTHPCSYAGYLRFRHSKTWLFRTSYPDWLPVRQRVDFKVATFVHRSLPGILPTYLADDCRLVADARERRLRSTESRTCVVARTYSSFGERAFAAAGPVLWNSLPSHLKEADLLYSQFRRSLKTFLFG